MNLEIYGATVTREPAKVGVVIPAHNAAAEIGDCLEAVLQSGVAPDDIVVVDDGSRDETGKIARAHGAKVARNQTPQRPALARNAGVNLLDCDIVLFVDADVVIRPDVRDKVLAHFKRDAGLSAVFGSYDTQPRAPGVLSQYRNLLHHFTHQMSRTDATTFWTGLGAVRRATFLELGGLDREWESIEDVELGLRLTTAGGKIRFDPQMQGTHLKHWTLRSMVRTDLWGRAIPWTRLVMRGRARLGDLNTTVAARVSAAAILLTLISIAASPFLPGALVVAVAGALIFLAANAPFFGFLLREKGLVFLLRAMPYHVLYYMTATAGYCWVRFREGVTQA